MRRRNRRTTPRAAQAALAAAWVAAAAALGPAAPARADVPLEFAPLQQVTGAPPYPVEPFATQVLASLGGQPELLEAISVTVQAVDGINPSGPVPLTVVASPSADGSSFPIELRWPPSAQQPFPDELIFDLRVALSPDGEHTPGFSDLSVGSVARGILVQLGAELAHTQQQLDALYASHFIEAAVGGTFDASLFDPDVAVLDTDPPRLRLAFRVVRQGPETPAPDEPVLVLTTTGSVAPAPEVAALPAWANALLAAALGALAAATGSRAECTRPRA